VLDVGSFSEYLILFYFLSFYFTFYLSLIRRFRMAAPTIASFLSFAEIWDSRHLRSIPRYSFMRRFSATRYRHFEIDFKRFRAPWTQYKTFSPRDPSTVKNCQFPDANMRALAHYVHVR
jgi:hypothetical protein